VSNVNDIGVSSGDQYGRINVNTTEIVSMQKTLSGTLLEQLNGNYFRIMLFFKSVPLVNTTAKVCIKSGVTVLSETNKIILGSSYIQEIGSLRLPPFVSDYSDLDNLTFNLSLVNTSGSYVSDLDAIYLIPLKGWRKLDRFNGVGIEPGNALIDDEIENELYILSGGVKRFDYTSYGDKIMIYPHRINQLFFMFNDLIDTHNPYENLKIYVDYRPRKITL